MCGISGFLLGRTIPDPLDNVITRMTDSLTHRGPDDSGIWIDNSIGLALGHRRLSILDLSPAGHQPMSSACERFVIVFNGEIYNHLDLRNRLHAEEKAPVWRGHADTETLLACFTAWGIEKTLQSMVGMFSIALWDRQYRQLTLARDRMGEKPLYYGWQGDTLLFGSELKAFKHHPDFKGVIDRNALTLLLRHNCIPAPYSIYQGISKLVPGHYLTISLDSLSLAKTTQPKAYWQLNHVVESGLANPFSGSVTDAIDLLQSQLSTSIAEQMLSDVSLGAFLSGGVDSSTVVALMQAQSRKPVKTFTIGFGETSYNEAVYANAVAHHLGTDHTEMYVRPEDALAIIPRLPSIYCEPFSDSSQIPTLLVSQLARQHVSVALSGDGGDELFGGYNRYLTAHKVWSKMQCWPGFSRRMVAGILRSVSPFTWDLCFELAKPLLPKQMHLATPGDKAQKLADVLTLSDSHAFFYQLTSHWKDPARVVLKANEPETLLTNPMCWPKTDSFEHWMMAMDTQTYMADDILVKVDRAAMATSLETRVPMLDHRVVELAWRMPLDFKIRNGQGKWLLRQVLYRHVPQALIERPKMGFGIPIGSWLRGPLREWAESLLDEQRLQQEGYFNPLLIRQLWRKHLSGKHNWQHHLWTILMFQAWLEVQ